MKQFLSLAYNIKKKNASKKMADGGMVPDEDRARGRDPVAKAAGGGSQSNMELAPGKVSLSDSDRKMRAVEVMERFKQEHDDINNLNNRDAEATYSLAPKEVNYGRNEDDQRPADHEMPDSPMDRVHPNSKSSGMNMQANARAISDAIMAKQKSQMLAKGGMAGDMQDDMGGMDQEEESQQAEFLSHDADEEAFPGDHSSNEMDAESEGMDLPEDDNKKATLARILADIRSRHMGARKS